jgi:putative transcriptional regulator
MMPVSQHPPLPYLPTHHVEDTMLIDYAAGNLCEPVGLVVATHLALCPACRRAVADYEVVGGALLEDMAPEPLAAGSLEAMLAQLDDGEPAEAKPPERTSKRRPIAAPPVLPEPLRSYVGCDPAEIPWRPVIRGIDEFELPVRSGPTRTRLMRIRAGTAIPRHTHGGLELTLALAGGFHDQAGHYLRGDLSVSDPSVDHRPMADTDGDCLCLWVTEAPLRLTGPIGRLLNPFFRF